jgi:hypothetical protein
MAFRAVDAPLGGFTSGFSQFPAAVALDLPQRTMREPGGVDAESKGTRHARWTPMSWIIDDHSALDRAHARVMTISRYSLGTMSDASPERFKRFMPAIRSRASSACCEGASDSNALCTGP